MKLVKRPSGSAARMSSIEAACCAAAGETSSANTRKMRTFRCIPRFFPSHMPAKQRSVPNFHGSDTPFYRSCTHPALPRPLDMRIAFCAAYLYKRAVLKSEQAVIELPMAVRAQAKQVVDVV